MNRVFALVATATYANALDLMTQTSASAKDVGPCDSYMYDDNLDNYYACMSSPMTANAGAKDDVDSVDLDPCNLYVASAQKTGNWDLWDECTSGY